MLITKFCQLIFPSNSVGIFHSLGSEIVTRIHETQTNVMNYITLFVKKNLLSFQRYIISYLLFHM